jgi:indolepyruvate ferredoxin oxidoreductase
VLGSASSPSRRQTTLAERYQLDEGRVFLTGVQALVRVLLDQHRADAQAGLHTATLVSGYQGSPLAAFDREVARLGPLAAEHELVLRPAVNEELGATAVWGSQLTRTLPRPRYDGVLGVWYGKAPGVDRSADAIRHGNYVGTDSRGGVLALCGDDPACKSSTIPSASESLLAALQVPVLVPGSVQEILDIGRHAIACSRASGLWAALKVVTNIADAAATVRVGLHRVEPVMPELEWHGAPYVHHPSAHLVAPQSLEMERSLVEIRVELAKLYAQTNRLNRIVANAPAARVGVVAAGATVHNVRGAVASLGLGEDGPVRMLQLGMIYPLDEESIRKFAAGLDEIVVLEEKAPFLERLVRDALYAGPATPAVVGKRDDRGHSLVPAHGTLDADGIARILGARLLKYHELPGVRDRLDQLDQVARRPAADLRATRTPFFCSGCPHNSSTVAPDDAIVGAGIGCHTMVMRAHNNHGNVIGVTQMGGEGAQWIGAAPFVDVPHFVQNLGDGTFHHSGSLAIRAAVAAGLNITYKLLFNGYVAMTGGQQIEGQLGVMAAAHSLAAEGVRQIVITTHEPENYSGQQLPPVAEVRHRREIMRTQHELAQVSGVTVLLHDQACAAELRRERKTGRAPDPPQRVIINERVCEGCGDCGAKSGCLSVEPVDTEFGRKTRINQTSCNKDYSCLDGDCPSFLTVTPPPVSAPPVRVPATTLPDPETCAAADVRIRLVGIGGTGVVTVSQVLSMAALLDGRHATGLDQTGLSQKAGQVVSDVRITRAPIQEGVTFPSETADVLLAFDLLGAADAHNLRVATPERTVAIVSDSAIPTGRMVVDVSAPVADAAAARATIDATTHSTQNVYLDAQLIAQRLLGDTTPANMIVLGAAGQAGVLPVSLDALREAIRLNGAAVERNLAALDWGRAWVAAQEAVVAALEEGTAPPLPVLSTQAHHLINRVTAGHGELRRLLEIRIPDLIGWGGLSAAVRYSDALAHVHANESELIPGSTALTEAVARGLHKLMAYKDEYEVARLHLEGLGALPDGSKFKFHLHPPLLRALGLRRKLTLGRWFVPALWILRHGKVLRGTPLDFFGYARVRRIERGLPAEYLALVNAALGQLTPDTLELALEAAASADIIRGYEQIKLQNIELFRAHACKLRTRLENHHLPELQ